ncbi:MAG: sigma-70 family RNA polymerase sigma factor [Ruminococcaceae bacterium]|nr:sigma-70 family RNA polymerase sigma factor [Oscillospiraceae bacterium]
MEHQSLPIHQAAAGDGEAFGQIVCRMEPLIHDQIRRLACEGLEAEDLAQEALIGLLAAVRTYRPEGGAAFTTYATTCIRHRLLDAIRRVGGKVVNEVPLKEDTDLPDPSADPALRIQDLETSADFLARMQQRLTPLEYKVMLLRLSECSYEEIAIRLNTNKKAVDNAIQRLRRKLTRQ